MVNNGIASGSIFNGMAGNTLAGGMMAAVGMQKQTQFVAEGQQQYDIRGASNYLNPN